jgi:hypothetical protein
MLHVILVWLNDNKTELWLAFGLPFVVFTIAKIPDPRLFEGRWFYPLYYAFFQVASRWSASQWNKLGGVAKIPLSQVPRLKETPSPVQELKFETPDMYPFDENENKPNP